MEQFIKDLNSADNVYVALRSFSDGSVIKYLRVPKEVILSDLCNMTDDLGNLAIPYSFDPPGTHSFTNDSDIWIG